MLNRGIYKAYAEVGKKALIDVEVVITLARAMIFGKFYEKINMLAEMKTFKIRTNPEPFIRIILFMLHKVK